MKPDDIHAAIVQLANTAQQLLPNSRETSLVLTKLDEAALPAAASHRRASGEAIHA